MPIVNYKTPKRALLSELDRGITGFKLSVIFMVQFRTFLLFSKSTKLPQISELNYLIYNQALHNVPSSPCPCLGRAKGHCSSYKTPGF